MKRSGGRIFVIIGLVLAIISGVGVFVVLATAEPQAAPIQTSPVVVSFQQIAERTEISPDQVGQVAWPQTIPTPIGAYSAPSDVVGKLAKYPIYTGQSINNEMVISKSDAEARHSNASLILDKGQVAVAFPVSVDSSVAEAIQVGDRVDLIVTYSVSPQTTTAAQNNGPYNFTQKTLENILILQVGPWPRAVGEQSSSQGGGSASTVTFQLTEQDALTLKQIEGSATSYAFVLRAANDDQIFTTEPVTLEYLNKRFNFNIPGMGQ